MALHFGMTRGYILDGAETNGFCQMKCEGASLRKESASRLKFMAWKYGWGGHPFACLLSTL